MVTADDQKRLVDQIRGWPPIDGQKRLIDQIRGWALSAAFNGVWPNSAQSLHGYVLAQQEVLRMLKEAGESP